MLLVIHNLPSYMRYTDVKSLILSKCGITEIILDNLINDGDRKKVTLGLAEEGDAAIIARKLNGLFLDGAQLYVEDVRPKKEQPYRPSQGVVEEMSQKSFPGYQTAQNYYGSEADANTMAMNMSMMYNNMAMGGMYYMPMASDAQNFVNYGQQASVSEYPVHSLDYLSNQNAGGNGYNQSDMVSNTSLSSQRWDNQSNVTSNNGWDSRQPFFAQSSSGQQQKSAPQHSNDPPNRGSAGRHPSPEERRPPMERRSRRDNYDEIRVSLPNEDWKIKPNNFDLGPQRNATSNRFDSGPVPANPDSFDIEPRRIETDYRSYKDRKEAQVPMDRRLGNPTKRAIDRDGDICLESQPKRMTAYPDRSNYPQNDYDMGRPKYSSYSQDAQPKRKQDSQPAYYSSTYKKINKPPNVSVGSSNTFAVRKQVLPTPKAPSTFKKQPSFNPGPPHKQGPVTKPGPASKYKGPPSKNVVTIKEIEKSNGWRSQVAAAIAKEIMKEKNMDNLIRYCKALKTMKACIRSRLALMLGDWVHIKMPEMHKMYREKYPVWDDDAFFLQVLEQADNEPDPPMEPKRDNEVSGELAKPVAQPVSPKVYSIPKMPVPLVESRPKPKAMPIVESRPKPSFKLADVQPILPNSMAKPSKSFKAATKMVAKMEYKNPEMYKLKPKQQNYVDEELDKIFELFMSVVKTPDYNTEQAICDKIANNAFIEAKNVIRLNLTKRLLNVSTGLMVSIWGKVNKQSLLKFLEPYGVKNVSKTKKGTSYIVHLSCFKKYDDLCALGFTYIDGYRVTIKAIHVAGPQNKISRNEIEMNRRNFIRSQIQPLPTTQGPKTYVKNDNNLTQSKPAETIKPEIVDTKIAATDDNNIQKKQCETKSTKEAEIAIQTVKTEAIHTDEPNTDNVKASTKVSDNTQNINSESNTNLDAQSKDTNNDNLNDKGNESENNDIPNDNNTDFDPDTFEADDVEVDDDDLEDY